MPVSGDYEPSPSAGVRNQVEAYESSDGAVGGTMRGMPVIVMTTVGAKTQKLRKVPLMRVEHNGTYAAVASLGGAPSHPLWYHNLKANPMVELQDGPVRHELVARELSGGEKAVWWERAVAAFPDYADYQRRTSREIPVFALEPRRG